MGKERSGIESEKTMKINFSINQNFVYEVFSNVIPLDICGVILGIPYFYVRDNIFIRRVN